MKPRLFPLFLVVGFVSIGNPDLVHSEDAPGLEVHEFSVWVGEPQGKGVNSVADYISTMPGLVETDRSRRRETGKQEGPPPLSVMTLYGQPPEVVDIDLKMTTGRPVAQWPKSEGKSNRLRWLDLKVTKELTNVEGIATVPEGHWFHQARALGGLYLQLKRGGRIERFLTYDLELQTTLPVRLDGSPDQYKIANTGKYKLHDILLIVPVEGGRRVGWLDVANPAEGAAGGGAGATPAQPANAPPQAAALPAGVIAVAAPGAVIRMAPGQPAGNPQQPGQPNAAGQPAGKETITDIPLSEPLKTDSDEFQKLTTGELRRRLEAAGMTEGEINLLHSLYAKHFFEADGIQLVFRLSKEALEELTPLAVEPESAKVKRVALVVARKVDPSLREDVQKLITNLGDSSYEQREKAEKRLKELGRLAIPNLKEALKNKDLEVVMRAERLLMINKEPLGAEQ